MANGDECIHCGLQETVHKYPHYAREGEVPCGTFTSPVEHHKDCPVVDCNGDCEETLAQQKFEADAAQNKLRNSWFISRETGKLVQVDLSD